MIRLIRCLIVWLCYEVIVDRVNTTVFSVCLWGRCEALTLVLFRIHFSKLFHLLVMIRNRLVKRVINPFAGLLEAGHLE